MVYVKNVIFNIVKITIFECLTLYFNYFDFTMPMASAMFFDPIRTPQCSKWPHGDNSCGVFLQFGSRAQTDLVFFPSFWIDFWLILEVQMDQKWVYFRSKIDGIFWSKFKMIFNEIISWFSNRLEMKNLQKPR